MTKQQRAAALVAAEAQAAAPKAETAEAMGSTGKPSLRDEFAMSAPPLPAWWTNAYMQRTDNRIIDAQAVAEWAYEYADAMLRERAK